MSLDSSGLPEHTTLPKVKKPKAVKVDKPKRKMRPGGGKAKGSGFESAIAKKLSAALPINFIRSPGSGARIGGKNFATIGAMMGEEAMKLFNADVVPVNESQVGFKFLFSVECKFYATQDHFTALASGAANLFKWFEEAVVDAAKIGRQPVLIFTWNRTPVFVAVLAGTNAGLVSPAISISRPGRSLDIYELDELLKHPDFWVQKV
jgi:hypothetical protein